MNVQQYHVRFAHYRDADNLPPNVLEHSPANHPINGVTVCSILPHTEKPTKDAEPLVIGMAFCSEGDTFEKETGRKIALKRALEQSDLDKETRGNFWEEYRTSTLTPRWDVARN